MSERLTVFDNSVWRVFVKPGEVTEVRILKLSGKSAAWGNDYARGTVSGYFDDHLAFCKAVREVDKAIHGGVYFSLQVIDPRLIGRTFNRLRVSDITTSDTNVCAYRWLPIDMDPVRPSGISSSDAELQEALIRRDIVAECVVAEMGFSIPIKAMSGNGAHLLFRLPDLPVTDQNKKMIRDILTGLAQRFDTEKVKIDTTVFNPARIWKLYGTTARKGDPVPAGPNREARPHRMAFIDDLGGNS
jgi:hypothetical protein